MLFIVEIPHQRAPSCWIAEDKRDFINAVERANTKRDCVIYDARTIGEIMNDFDVASAEDAREKGYDVIAALIQATAPDRSVMVYRSWETLDFTNFALVALDEFACYRSYLAHDLSALIVLENECEAREWLKREDWRGYHNGRAAADALTKKLNSI